MKKRKVLFIVHHRKDRSPGQRFRFEQYLNFLEQNGFECHLSNIINEKQDGIFYSPGNFLGKISIIIKGAIQRWKDVKRANDYDIIFLFREGFFLGTTYFERKLAQSNAKMIFDFDDAIWNDNVSDANKKFAFLKNPKKTEELITISDFIIAGNQYLADYAKQFNNNVKIIPTTIDTEQYQLKHENNSEEKVIIGWSGSPTTIQHFNLAVPVLKKIKEKYGDKVIFKVIGDTNYINKELSIKGVKWTSESEIKELSAFDIGIMPLPDDKWAKGKCGLKGLQYMALGIPCIMSPVGVNTKIIQDGVNGFLAGKTDEWEEKLIHLIESVDLRNNIGKKGKATVVNEYSVLSQKNNYLNTFQKVLTI